MKELKKQSKAEKVTSSGITKQLNNNNKDKSNDNNVESKDDHHDEDLITNSNEPVSEITPFSLPSQEVISMASNSKALLLVLVGLPGSGKSTLADIFSEDDSVKRHWEICCQDVLKTRFVIEILLSFHQYLYH